MFSNGVNLNPSSYKVLFSSSSGVLNVPVKPSAVIYSQFDYVRGVSAKSGQNGISVDRIRILNSLINQLVSMKKSKSADENELSQLTDEQKDKLIETYQKEIEREVAAAQVQPASYGIAGLMPETGSVISIMA